MHGAVACACHPIDSCPYTKAKAPTVCEDTVCEDTVCSLMADFSSNMRLIIKLNVTAIYRDRPTRTAKSK